MEAHIKIDIDQLVRITKLNPTAKNTLLGMSVFLDDENRVDLSAHRRAYLLNVLGISKNTFSNGLITLQAKGVITRIGNGYYEIDKLVLIKGE